MVVIFEYLDESDAFFILFEEVLEAYVRKGNKGRFYAGKKC